MDADKLSPEIFKKITKASLIQEFKKLESSHEGLPDKKSLGFDLTTPPD